MRYDPENDPYETLNDRELLDDTPIGTLRVVPLAGQPTVVVMHKHDDEIVARILITLGPKQNPLEAIYGRRFHERESVEALHEAQARASEAIKERHSADLSKDFIKELDRFESKHWHNGDEAIARVLGAEVP